ncbi:MAG: aroA [Flavipsychrobacter sp.]|jgi:3-phosphoshikimate 1-carboxyvinyltransferase|nr:aroA [Flavipsychrobacter sp.]
MKAIIEPGNINGIIAAPPSKSMTQRVYAAALLHKGKTVIHNAGISDDENAALQIIRQLGAKVVSLPDKGMEITSNGVVPISGVINCNESGLGARLFTPIAGLCDQRIQIEGHGTLLRRPMDGFGEILPQLNCYLTGFAGNIPFAIQGPMQAKSIQLDASDGSQFLSGLLFAYSSCVKEAVTITVKGLKSKPYIDMTLEVLAHFGKTITHNNYKEFIIDPAVFTHKDELTINVTGDWSSAAYYLVAGAVAGDITVSNMQIGSKQADVAILEVLKSAGAEVTQIENSFSVKKTRLNAFELDATDCPDLFPVLAILGACCDGESHIRGVHRLFHKESNRVESITEMLHDFAVPFSVEDDTLFITGVPKLQGTIIDSYHDHRIVMAAAIGALRANGPVEITFAESVNKSYPDFFKELIACGGNVRL